MFRFCEDTTPLNLHVAFDRSGPRAGRAEAVRSCTHDSEACVALLRMDAVLSRTDVAVLRMDAACSAQMSEAFALVKARIDTLSLIT